MNMNTTAHAPLPSLDDSRADLVQSYPPNYSFDNSSESSFTKADSPPSLEYDIASKKKSITIAWIMIILTNALLPVGLFYILHYGTNMSEEAVINVATIATSLTVAHWPWRLWKLLQHNGARAPRDRTKLTWDTFQWNFLFGIFPVTALCVLASEMPSVRMLSLAPVVLFAITAAQLIIFTLLSHTSIRTPCRMSSQPKGSLIRPAVYAVIEDVTACDGAGGQAYRERLNVRYEASPPFRKLVHNLSLYLGFSFLFMTSAVTVLIFVLDENVGLGVSTAILWGWCGLMGWWGVWYAKRGLEEEKLWWSQRFYKEGGRA